MDLANGSRLPHVWSCRFSGYQFLVDHPVRFEGAFFCTLFISLLAVISMFAALSVRRVASYRRPTFSILTIASLFILGFIFATTSTTNYITRHPFFTQDTHHDDDDNGLHQAVFHSDVEEGKKPWSQISDLNCAPEQYSAGYWRRRPQSLLRPMLTPEDVYPISGFQGCASSREVDWHLAKNWYDEEEVWVRPWRGNVSAYDWIPGSGCEAYSKPTQQQLVTQLVERGGWLIIGGMCHESPTFFGSLLHKTFFTPT